MRSFKLKSTFAFFLGIGGFAFPAQAADVPAVRELRSLTEALPGIDFGDPSPPDFSEPGIVRVYTTGSQVLEWRKNARFSAPERFLRGEPPHLEHLRLYHSDGVTELDPAQTGEDAWDPTVQRIGRERVLFGGVMRPTDARKNALWPDDHWNRRTHAFTEKRGRWVMKPDSIFGPVPEMPTWIGHNYGHGILREGGIDYVFYERVSDDHQGHPWKTEIFMRKLGPHHELIGKEYPSLRLPQKVWPAAEREFGGGLVEGPRPFKVGRYFLIAFSAGDYHSDNYGIHLAWSETIEGPFTPYLTKNGQDLQHFGQAIEKKLALTWGAARPAFFQLDQKWWVLCHGIRKSRGPFEEGHREVFLAPVQITEASSGPPLIRILQRD